MSETEALLGSRDELLDWIGTHAPELHVLLGNESRLEHRGVYGECDDEPCNSAHSAMTEAYRVMEAS